MGMPVIIVLADSFANGEDVENVFDYLQSVDEKFSTYKTTSEISRINSGKIATEKYSEEVKHIFSLAEQTKKDTHGFFDMQRLDGSIDPSGIVKGYAIHQAAEILKRKEYKNFLVEIAGDAEMVGLNEDKKWKVGIENPFNRQEIIKVVYLQDKGIATSGTYIRGQHIYNPTTRTEADEVASVTVIADNCYEADRLATAVFAMGEKGISFLENFPCVEGYMVKKDKIAVMTSKFSQYTQNI